MKTPTVCDGDPGAWSDVDLVARVVGVQAAMLDTVAPTVRELGAAPAPELRRAGLTERQIRRLRAAVELARRYGARPFVPGAAFRGSSDIYAHYREVLRDERRERFYAVLLDNKHRVIKHELISLGSLTASIVHPRDVFCRVVEYAAAAVVFVHNHPSGDPTPSREDLEITRRLRDVGELLGVRVLDHVVVGAGRYVSFVDDGYW